MDKRIVVLSVFILCAACGGEEIPPNPPTTANSSVGNNPINNSSNGNNTATNNAATNNTAVNNTSTNNAATNNTSTNNMTTPSNNTTPINNLNPGVQVTEAEPNNDNATATRFAPNDTLVGTAANMDNDYFAIDLVAGSVLQVELSAVQLVGEMYVDLVDPTDTVPERTAGGNQGDTRQFFIPVTGRYLLRVTDLTAQSATYEIATSVLPANATGGFAVPGSVDANLDDYGVDVYTYRADADASVRAGVTADRSPVLSDMDALLIVYDPAAGLVALNDDVDAMTVDPEVVFDQVSGRTYWVVVDAVYLEVGGDNSYTLAAEIQ